MDGATLTSVLHQRGVNVRYLGTLLTELDRVEERGRLTHIKVLACTYFFSGEGLSKIFINVA